MCIFLDISAFLFLLLPLSVCSLSFDLPSIGNDDANVHIKVEGNASITNHGIQLTPYDRGSELKDLAGRAKYVEPLHLWDKSSGNLADFTTNFTFNINSDGSSSYADGLTFFLANFSTPFDTYLTRGGGLGLMNKTLSTSPDPFVAVVFDTFSNYENRPYTCVSINVKSVLDPVNSTTWFNDIAEGKDNDATITYNASSKILRVVFTGFQDGQYLTDSLSIKVDLREHLPEFVSIGFSAATGALFEKNTVSSWKFNSTSLKRPDSIISPSPTPSPPRGEKKKKKKGWKGVVIGLSIGVPILVSLLALAIYTCVKKTPRGAKGNDNHEIIVLGQAMDTEFQMVSSGPKKFSYTELAIATNNFAEEHKLGEGGFGGVYRGLIRDLKLDVAVKRVSSGSKQGIKEYTSEVKIISRLRHRNLVPLHGWCHEKGELLLVYEYMPEGSLDSHLFKRKSPLNWGLRYRIAQGLASALFYLHEEWEKCVLHRDIKSSNVMLDKDFNARLGDFGLAWLVEHENAPEKTICGGTPGYVAPECNFTYKTSKESDVYSFGIVALELACGKRAILVNEAEGVKSLVEWVWDLYGMGKLLEAADPKLLGKFDEQEMEELMMIGLWCAHPDSSARPKISHALHCLKFKVQLPSLPPKMPKPIYSTCFNVSSLHWQKFENQMSSGLNSCPSHFTLSSTTDASSSVSASYSHTH